MTKTIWMISDGTTNPKTELTYYHFGKEPQFPKWYMEANYTYTIEMMWNLKLVKTPKMFFRCLTHFYSAKAR